jgi:two-component system sensor histidine kinase TctE
VHCRKPKSPSAASDNAAHCCAPCSPACSRTRADGGRRCAIDGAQAQAALEGARRLARTTQQLLALARSDAASRTESLQEEISLPEMIKVCVEARLASADACGIDLGADFESAVTRGSAWMLEEALGNLTDNAIAATPTGGSVTLRCGMTGGCAWFEVGDTGVGIPAAERAQVFERFYRASNARAAGSGLGLAIVREVARLHRAALTVEDGVDGRDARTFRAGQTASCQLPTATCHLAWHAVPPPAPAS